jgi:hypothetical protein
MANGEDEVVGECPHCPRIKTLAELIDWATMYLSLWEFQEQAEWRLRGKRSLGDLCERAIGRCVWQWEAGPERAALEQLMAYVGTLTPKEVQKMVQQALAVLDE